MKWADTLSQLDRSGFTYTALFCEENIWCLCRDLAEQGVPPDSMHVLFFSSLSRQTPILQQRSSPAPDQPVWWDYHVVLLIKMESDNLVFDFDSCLDFPVSANTYFLESFYHQHSLQPQNQIYFRTIPADEFIDCFTSSRRHMLDEQGQPLAPLPDYPPINLHKEKTIDLWNYLAMSDMKLMTAEHIKT